MAAESSRRRLPDSRQELVNVSRDGNRVTHIHRTTAMCAAVLIASLAFGATALTQNSDFVAPGRVEGAGPALSIGVAAAGIVHEVTVREGSRVRAGETLIKLDCRPTEADFRARNAQLEAAQAAFDRARNGSRPDEIAVGEAVVGYSQARADEAQKALDRTEALKEGVTVTTAHFLKSNATRGFQPLNSRKHARDSHCSVPVRARKISAGRKRYATPRRQTLIRSALDWISVPSAPRWTAP